MSREKAQEILQNEISIREGMLIEESETLPDMRLKQKLGV